MIFNENITVLVLSYNSEDTIIETLNSIYNQDYPLLKLIINDDGSTDSSIHLISDWINNNRERFLDIKLFSHNENQGINKSFDYAIKQANTKWLKFIAADDILLNNCITKNLEFVTKNNIETLVYSKNIPFREVNGIKEILELDSYELYYISSLPGLSAKYQYKKLLRKDIQFSPTGFINVDLYKKLGGINLSIKNIEDWPLRLLFTSTNNKLYFMDEYTVMYRIGNSVSHSNGKYYNRNHIYQVRDLKKILIYPNISCINVIYYINEFLENLRYIIIINFFNNKKNKLTRIIAFFTMILDLNKWKKIFWKLK